MRGAPSHTGVPVRDVFACFAVCERHRRCGAVSLLPLTHSPHRPPMADDGRGAGGDDARGYGCSMHAACAAAGPGTGPNRSAAYYALRRDAAAAGAAGVFSGGHSATRVVR
eukprot:gene12139-11133_t